MGVQDPVLVVVLRYRIDRQVPFLAITTLALSIVLLGLAVAQDEERFIKLRPTIGSLLFASSVAIGMLFRPTLLQRSLGYRLSITARGWQVLQLSWIGVALSLAGLNERIRGEATTELWVLYASLSGPLVFGLYFAVTWTIAWWFWSDGE